ncbi:Cytochrome oxidase assembly [Halocaridina rubra]|uniref:Cytochrome c oxidase assembly protein COX16 homolog, mitochondrial n=1 Tax=Halocaridina rubra TaxID=373956 RepID=A0AAN8X883_HALRR
MGKSLLQRRVIRVGLPFLVLIVGGSFGLKEFAQLRYDFRNKRSVTKDEADKIGVEMKTAKEVTLESEYEKVKSIDTTSWENIRGPRPWEEGNKLYEQAVERAQSLK